MKILTFDELPSSMEIDRSLLHLAAFGNVYSRSQVQTTRRGMKIFADYVGVFAVEGARLLGQVLVLRLPYAFRDGPATISGISAVETRPDRARSGVARSLLTEVHRREREAGLRFGALWTNRSWGAHHLYESLGYRDVYTSPWVVHPPLAPRARRPRGRRARPGRPSDYPDLDHLHEREGHDRLGYYCRPRGYWPTVARVDSLDPAESFLVVRRAGELQGYAYLDRHPNRVVCGELVAASPDVRKDLVEAVAQTAKAVPFAFQHTLVTDAPELFQGPGWARLAGGWYGMMGGALGREWSSREAVRQFASDDPKFLCLAGDRY